MKAYCFIYTYIIFWTGLKPMQPMQLHWATRHGVWAGCSFLPDTP